MRTWTTILCGALLLTGCKEGPREKAIREARMRQDAGVQIEPVPATATLLASGQNVPRNLLADATHLYWLNEGMRAEGKAGVFRVSKSGGEPQTLFEGQGVHGIALGADWVYAILPRHEVVLRLPKGGGEPERAIEQIGGLSAIAADDTHVYLSTEDGVVRYPVEGGKPQTVVTELFTPVGLSLDDSNLYWYSALDGDFKRAPKKGGKQRNWIKQELTLHGHFAHGNEVFWTLGSDKKAELRKASGSKSGHQVVTGGLSIPVELAADETHVYWTNGEQVMRVAREGGTATVVVEGTDRSIGIAVDGTSVYWTDRGGRIQKVAR